MATTQSSDEKNRKKRFKPPADEKPDEAEADNAEDSAEEKPAAEAKPAEKSFDDWVESDEW